MVESTNRNSIGVGLDNIELIPFNAQGSEYELFLEVKLRTDTTQNVVVKQYHKSMLYRAEEDMARIQSDMKVLIHSLPAHPNLCAYLGFFEHSDHVHVVREYIPGHLLSSLIPRGIDTKAQLRISIQLADAITFLYSTLESYGMEFSHCPLSFQNIVYNSELDRVILVDYQLSALQGSVQMKWDELNRATQGIPLYPPELFRTGEYAGEHSSVYNLAVILYAMCMKKIPRVRRYHLNEIKDETIKKLLTENILDVPDQRYRLGKWSKSLRAYHNELLAKSMDDVDINYEQDLTLKLVMDRAMWKSIAKNCPTGDYNPEITIATANASGLSRPGDRGPMSHYRVPQPELPSFPLCPEKKLNFVLYETIDQVPRPPKKQPKITQPSHLPTENTIPDIDSGHGNVQRSTFAIERPPYTSFFSKIPCFSRIGLPLEQSLDSHSLSDTEPLLGHQSQDTHSSDESNSSAGELSQLLRRHGSGSKDQNKENQQDENSNYSKRKGDSSNAPDGPFSLRNKRLVIAVSCAVGAVILCAVLYYSFSSQDL